MLYDLLSFGSPSDIKGNMVKSFILHQLYSENELDKNQIKNRIESFFNISGDSSYSDNLINKLRQEYKIEPTNNHDNVFKLTIDEKQRLSSVIGNFELSEYAFIDSVKETLRKYSLEKYSLKVISEIKKLYESNYNVNIQELNSNSGDINSVEKATKKFRKFIYKITNSITHGNQLVEELLEIGENNDFLQKMCAGTFFANVVQSDRLSQFHDLYKSNNVRIFLDTQILLRAICTYYDPKLDYKNHYLKAARNLIEFANNHSLKLKTSFEYCLEVVHHFKNAINIIPFTRIKELNCLGESRNVFYTFYKHLSENNYIDDSISFEKFINDFGFKENVNKVSVVKD